MWWSSVKKWLKVSAAWCRQHWRWVVIGTAAIALYLLGRRSAKAQALQAKLALDTYKADKEAIEKAYKKEIEDVKNAQKNYNKALAHISQEFSNKTDSLNKEKEKRIRKMIDKAKKDPDEVDRILEREMGIKKI